MLCRFSFIQNMTTLIPSSMSFLRLTASRMLFRAKNGELLSCSCRTFLSSKGQQNSNKEESLSPDDYEMIIKEREEAANLEEIRNVSSLPPQEYNIYHGKPPELPYKDLARRRKLYARYGSSSGEDPRIMWPSRQEIMEMMKDEKSEELALHEKLAKLQSERDAAEQQRLARHKMIEKNMAQMSKWIAEYQASARAEEDEVRSKQEKKEALLDEAREYFGYKIRANDPKFQQMIEEKEAQEKKEAKERKKKEKARKGAERLKQDVILMGLQPEEEKTS